MALAVNTFKSASDKEESKKLYSKVQCPSNIVVHTIVDLLEHSVHHMSRKCALWPQGTGAYIASNKHPVLEKGLATQTE